MISAERLYLAADGKTVVRHGDPAANTLLVGAGCHIDNAMANRLGLPLKPAVIPATASVAPPKPETVKPATKPATAAKPDAK